MNGVGIDVSMLNFCLFRVTELREVQREKHSVNPATPWRNRSITI